MQRRFQPRASQTLNKAGDGNAANEVNRDDLDVQMNKQKKTRVVFSRTPVSLN